MVRLGFIIIIDRHCTPLRENPKGQFPQKLSSSDHLFYVDRIYKDLNVGTSRDGLENRI